MKKVVQFIHGLNTGGAETLVKNYSLNLKKDSYDVSVVCLNHIPESPYENILKDNGIKVFVVDDYVWKPHSKNIFAKAVHKIQRYFIVKKILHELDPDIVHSHLGVNKYIIFSNLPKKVKIFHTVHTEPSKLWNNTYAGKIDYFSLKLLLRKHKLRFITLHKKMSKQVNKLFKVSDSIVLNNGIDFKSFEKPLSKKKLKERLGIPIDAFVVGHVGRFSPQKNHVFLVKTFKEIYRKNSNSFLLMVGDGSEKSKIQEMLKHENLNDRSLILSNRRDVADLMRIMNIFIFPSKYEGLGIVLIEAQKAGLPCFVSDTVPLAAKQTDLVTFLSLKLGATQWANRISEINSEKVLAQGSILPDSWNIINVVHQLEKIYSE